MVLAAIFAQHYSPSHNGVYIQNVGYCGYLCVASTGTVYTSVSRDSIEVISLKYIITFIITLLDNN